MVGTRGSRRLAQGNQTDRRFDPGEAADLRRTRSSALVDRLLDRADWLEPGERVLIEQVYRDQRPACEIGLLTGESPRVVRRRVRSIVRRLLSEKTAFVVGNERRWATTRRRVAKACFVEGRSMRDAGRTLGLSLHTIRRHVAAIDALFEGSEAHRVQTNEHTGWRTNAGAA